MWVLTVLPSWRSASKNSGWARTGPWLRNIVTGMPVVVEVLEQRGVGHRAVVDGHEDDRVGRVDAEDLGGAAVGGAERCRCSGRAWSRRRGLHGGGLGNGGGGRLQQRLGDGGVRGGRRSLRRDRAVVSGWPWPRHRRRRGGGSRRSTARPAGPAATRSRRSRVPAQRPVRPSPVPRHSCRRAPCPSPSRPRGHDRASILPGRAVATAPLTTSDTPGPGSTAGALLLGWPRQPTEVRCRRSSPASVRPSRVGPVRVRPRRGGGGRRSTPAR